MSKHLTPSADLASLLAGVVKAARVTVVPAMADEVHRASSAPGEAA